MNKQTARLLEQHSDTAFAAPNGIARLRELILTLAMQGKLVAQDPNDPPASELLKEIEAEKQRLHSSSSPRRRGSSKPKPLPPIKPKEVPYELPKGWEWVRLGDIGIWKSGSTPSRSNASFYGGDIPWVKSGEVKQGCIKTTEETITQAALDKCSLHINEKGSVLVAMYGANIGEVGILEIEAATNQAVCACKTYTNFDENYLLSLITSLKPYFLSQGAGAAQPNISREKIVATIFPLPPLAEQHRIVAKIDQLMARCDELEKLRAEREQKRRTVHTAALKKLMDATSPSFPRRRESSAPDDLDPRLRGGDESFANAWKFITLHFGELYSVKENVTELRKAILQLAFMGKLVPQDPQDQPASELLQEIEAEKRRLVKAGKIKTPKPLPEIKPEEVPYELPKGWEWVRLGEIVLSITGGGTPSKNNPAFWGGDIPWASVKDLNIDIYLDSTIDSITEKAVSSSSTNIIPKGSVIVCTRMGLGKIAINRVDTAINQDLKALTISSHVDQMFFFKKYKNYKITGSGMTVHGIRQDELLNFLFPLPPLPEQHRIVAKIDQLMALCNTLDQQIEAATGKQTALLNAVMAQIQEAA